MSSFDYMRGLATAELVEHARAFGSGNVIQQQNQWIAELQMLVQQQQADIADLKEKNGNLYREGRAILETRDEALRRTEVLQEENELLQRRSEELEIEQSARIAQSNTMVGEYEIIKSNPDIEPVFIAPGEENKLERARLREHFKQQAKENGGDTIHGALTREELLRYHEQRKSGIKNPSFD